MPYGLDSFDNDLMKEKLARIFSGEEVVDLPVYDFKTHTR